MHASGKNIIYIRQVESVKDFSMLFSLLHSFEWYKVRSNKDMLTITPAVLLLGGTQNLGLNTSFNSNSKQISNNLLPANVNVSDKQGFDFQSTTFPIKNELLFTKILCFSSIAF